MTDSTEKHSGRSSYRESLIEKRFLSDLLAALWPEQVEVLRPEVDIAGYDLVIEARGKIRHIQLKSTLRKMENDCNVRGGLWTKPAGCVICIVIDEDLKPLHYRWFGDDPQTPLPRAVNRKKAYRPGTKKERLDTYRVRPGEFDTLREVEEVIEKLFGPESRPPKNGSSGDCRPV